MQASWGALGVLVLLSCRSTGASSVAAPAPSQIELPCTYADGLVVSYTLATTNSTVQEQLVDGVAMSFETPMSLRFMQPERSSVVQVEFGTTRIRVESDQLSVDERQEVERALSAQLTSSQLPSVPPFALRIEKGRPVDVWDAENAEGTVRGIVEWLEGLYPKETAEKVLDRMLTPEAIETMLASMVNETAQLFVLQCGVYPLETPLEIEWFAPSAFGAWPAKVTREFEVSHDPITHTASVKAVDRINPEDLARATQALLGMSEEAAPPPNMEDWSIEQSTTIESVYSLVDGLPVRTSIESRLVVSSPEESSQEIKWRSYTRVSE
ncbi:MAG: hypothetical protein AAGA48_38370 [Myxococcota bacterium]